MATKREEKKFPPKLRKTAQRKIIWEIIQETGHLDAEELYLKAKKRQPRISLSTVYRCLTALKKKGYLQNLNYDRSHQHFEVKQPEHLHFVCSACKTVSELSTNTISKLKKEVEQALKVQIENIDLNLAGLCKKCQKKQI